MSGGTTGTPGPGDGGPADSPGDRAGGSIPGAARQAGAPIDPGEILGRAWALFSVAWPASLACYWGTVAVGWLLVNFLVIMLASLNVAIGDPSFTPFLEFARFLGLFLLPVWLWLGQGMGLLKIARKEPMAPADLFLGGPYLLTALLAIGVFLAITALPCLAAYLIVDGLVAAGGGDSLVAMVRRLLPDPSPDALINGVIQFESIVVVSLVLSTIVLGLWYAVFFAVRARLRPFLFLVIDRDAGVLESIRTAHQLSRGRVAALLIIHLAQFAINLAGMLLCCVGLLVSLPLTALISAVTYDALAADLPPLAVPEDPIGDDRD